MRIFLITYKKPIRLSFHKNDTRIGFSIRNSSIGCIILHDSIFILFLIVSFNDTKQTNKGETKYEK